MSSLLIRDYLTGIDKEYSTPDLHNSCWFMKNHIWGHYCQPVSSEFNEFIPVFRNYQNKLYSLKKKIHLSIIQFSHTFQVNRNNNYYSIEDGLKTGSFVRDFVDDFQQQVNS